MRPRKSIRSILMIWFLLFSVVPLGFVTGYSLIKYEEAISHILVQRLRASAREFETLIADYEQFVLSRMQDRKSEASLVFYISAGQSQPLRALLQQSTRAAPNSQITVFNNEGCVLASSSAAGSVSNPALPPSGADKASTAASPKPNSVATSKSQLSRDDKNLDYCLSDPYVQKLGKEGRLYSVAAANGSVPGTGRIDLVMIEKFDAKTGRTAGFVEEIVSLGSPFLETLKKRLDLEFILLDATGKLVVASHSDFALYNNDYFIKTVAGRDETLVNNISIRGEPFDFIFEPVKWGAGSFYVGLGASKKAAHEILRNINYAFFTVIGAIVLLLIITSVLTARIAVKPLNDLIEAIQKMQSGQTRAVEIPVNSDNEIGLLTEKFNEMSHRVFDARQALELKIKETEKAYQELKETQARLVHSSKMVSLGQLVAGVAHELNNPIGFIYSNMTILREYVEKMNKIIQTSQDEPSKISKVKAELDYDFMIQDLPRLIQSCEDGARRTRDIVLGLRNFSRLDEAKLKSVSLREGIENTLRLIAGELKGRIQVHTDFQADPEVQCYASQINQVFMNILTNACQAIEGEGEIWIRLRELNGDVSTGPSNVGDLVEISIRDSGKGMDIETQEKIFDPFFTTKSVGQGTGLGLSISYGIVRKHGGDIRVQSTLNRGTEFTITLPKVSV